MPDVFTTLYKPDVLSCLADLSNDEVFTPPSVVNDMLDMLPQELFESPDTTFLDPVCKSGVFLREIAKRLIKGLEDKIPDLQERVDHIFQKQLYGIAITELTSLLSRRSVYCSKYPNSKYSVSQFDDVQGNIRYKNVTHEWLKGKCCFCGATESEYGTQKRDGMESHAYEFIHTTKPQEIYNMKFDVIIGNPPYQLSDGSGGNGTSAVPIYNMFIEQAKKLTPKYLTMIIPARWYAGGRNLDEFRKNMLNDNHIRVICDFFKSEDCFPGVDLSGGVCYFLWERDNPGACLIKNIEGRNHNSMERSLLEPDTSTFIRFNNGVKILRKVRGEHFKSFSEYVQTYMPFGIRANIKPQETGEYTLYAYPNNGYCDSNWDISHKDWISAYKVFISKAYGERGDFPYLVLGKPFIGAPNSLCTETYLLIGPFQDQNEAQNVISYIKTKFFRFLVLLKKNTQNAVRGVYEFVPMQDFSKPWTDEELYAKYNLTQEEIDFIESMIRPME